MLMMHWRSGWLFGRSQSCSYCNSLVRPMKASAAIWGARPKHTPNDFDDAGGATLILDNSSRMRSPVSLCRVVWCNTRRSLFLYILSKACCTLSSLARLFNAFNARSSFEVPSDGRTLDRQIRTVDTCSEVLSTTASRAFVTSLGRRPASAWDWMYERVAVSKGNRIHRERNDSGMSEDLETNSCSRETTLELRSTREAIEATSPTIAAASAMLVAWMLTWMSIMGMRTTISFDVHNTYKQPEAEMKAS